MTNQRIMEVRPHRLLPVLTVSLTLLLAGVAQTAEDPECSLPPSFAEPADSGGTWDTEHLGSWAGNQNTVNAIWNGLRMESDDWDEGWGFHDLGNVNLMLPRLMNAGYLLMVVEQYAKHAGHGFWMPVAGVPDPIYNQGRWWAYASGHGEDEWQPKCDSSSNASYGYRPADWLYMLHLRGAYVVTAMNRGGTVVHETVHDSGVGHIDEDECNPPTISCDTSYGAYNPNTLGINYLMDAAVTVYTEPGSDGAYPLVAINGDVCSYLPRFSDVERGAAIWLIGKVAERFKYQPLDPSPTVQHRWTEQSFACEQCDPEDYQFDSNTCDLGPACNEMLNDGNAGVNLNNEVACNAYNNAIATAQGLTPEEVAEYKALQVSNTMECWSAKPESARSYCETKKATALHVDQVDDCGWLEDVHLPHISQQMCIEEFCHDEMSAYSGDPQDWMTLDPTGCVDYLCSDESCSNNLDQALCVKGFLMAQGDPDMYVAQCRWEKCERVMVECLGPMFDKGLWTPGNPIPGECIGLKDACELATKLATSVWISQELFLDPGPYRGMRENFRHSNPVRHFNPFMESMREAMTNGTPDEQLEQLAVQFTSMPEFISAMYHSAPEEFVWMFGKEGFDEVVGTSIRGVEPRAIDPANLTSEGQQALQQLQTLMTDQGLDEVMLNIGSFQTETGP